MTFPDNLPNPCGLTIDEIRELLQKEEYGYLPSAPFKTEYVVEERYPYTFCAGNTELLKIRIICTTEYGTFTFPIKYTKLVSSSEENKVPCFVMINFRDDVPDRYLPSEEIADSGYAVMSFSYLDITSDNIDYTTGLSGLLYPDGKRKNPTDCGKLAMWAWAAIRVLEYALTLPEINHEKISVAGHSRLGKTALLAGAMDERFYCAFSNNSGCSGAALSRNNKGETVAVINERFPFWFCENYKKYTDNEDSLPFDQHYLLAANSTHKVYVASAAQDLWADPENEYLSCIAASEYFKNRGLSGFIHPERLPQTGDTFHDGDIGYHLRAGKHYLSRTDWINYIKFLSKGD